MSRKPLLALLAVPFETLAARDQLRLLTAIAREMDRREAEAMAPLPRRERPRCGARCRDGHPCQAPVVWNAEANAPVNGRCKVHGGLSTGPKTPEGRQHIGEATRQRAQARRAAQAQAAAQARALAAYTQAVAAYERHRQRMATRHAWLDAGLAMVLWEAVRQAYQACLACGVAADHLRALFAMASRWRTGRMRG
jgi:hypothetical protein